ncbi:MAG: cellulase family glycosylhydrolase [Bacteroidales bacterium]|nr:cellulase family glycosylhydrolase [Bacteroidales bacterium]
MIYKFWLYTFFILSLSTGVQLFAQLTPQQAVEQMGRGINLGNTLDTREYEGELNVAQEYNFDDFTEAGFTCVRIPVTWNKRADTLSPYTIDSDFFDRVDEVIGWALDRKLFVVINAHHEEWLFEDPSLANLERFDSLWSQIAAHYKDYTDSLIFEMINEPYPMPEDTLNNLNERVLSIIRKTNPTRIVLFSGYMWANSPQLIEAAVPEDDYLMGYFHSYDPWPFAGEGNGTWGTTSDIEALENKFNDVQEWSSGNNIPVFLGEFGAHEDCDFNSRMRHYARFVELALNNGWAFAVWDDNGWFQVLEREARSWQVTKDIIINNTVDNPTDLSVTNHNGDSISIAWTNRVTDNDSILVERGFTASTLTELIKLPGQAASYTDTFDLSLNRNYYYRISAQYGDTLNLMSYPQRIKTEQTVSALSVIDNNYYILYPNPVKETLILRNDADDELIMKITIYNIKGVRLFDQYLSGERIMRLNTESLKSDTYIIEITTTGNTYRKLFIKL